MGGQQDKAGLGLCSAGLTTAVQPSTSRTPALLPPAPAAAGACTRLPVRLALRQLQHQQKQQSATAPRFLSSSSSSPSGKAAAADGSRDSKPAAPAATPDAVYNLPNAVSAVRLLSGPVIGYWLLQGHYGAATVALAISGASDWLDGFLARRMGASSVFGSYLDPLADKVLIGCVAAALLANGSMPPWLAAVVVGRDLLLVGGAFAFRLRGFGWRWPGREAFFRTADDNAATSGATPSAGTAVQPPGAGTGAAKGGAGAGEGDGGGGVAFMRPLWVSKANTALQLVLLGGYLTRGMYGWPGGELVGALELAVAATTSVSLAAYGTMALQGKLFK